VPAPASVLGRTLCAALGLGEGRWVARAASGLAARRLELARADLASAHRSTNRLTPELSGHINREAIDWSA